MLNQVMLVGRIKELITVEDKTVVTVTVVREYKNVDGEYETDDIKIWLYKNIAKSSIECCRPGDIIGVKGRLQTINNELRVAVDKISFVTSKGEKNDN